MSDGLMPDEAKEGLAQKLNNVPIFPLLRELRMLEEVAGEEGMTNEEVEALRVATLEKMAEEHKKTLRKQLKELFNDLHDPAAATFSTRLDFRHGDGSKPAISTLATISKDELLGDVSFQKQVQIELSRRPANMDELERLAKNRRLTQ